MRYLYVPLFALFSCASFAMQCTDDVQNLKSEITELNQSYEAKLNTKFLAYARAKHLKVHGSSDMYSIIKNDMQTSGDGLSAKIERLNRMMAASKNNNCKELVAIQQEKLEARKKGWPQIAKLLEEY